MILSNLHTHTPFCDGKSSAEETVLSAICRGFDSVGFSGHGYTPFDLRYCMRDTEGYISEVNDLRRRYRDKIKIFLGIEEDAFSPCERRRFDYVIGSCHYLKVGERYLPIDSSPEYFKKCLEAFEYDTLRLAESYYCVFCDYLLRRKPDIIGHFDLITKFDEKDGMRFLGDRRYLDIAKKYVKVALKSGAIFEVNTGAISRGYRTSPYPHEELLYEIKKADGRVTLSSDSHSAETLDFFFDEARAILKEVGFEKVQVLTDGGFVGDKI